LQPLFQWKGISTTYSECVSVALGKQLAMRMRHIVICGLSDSAVFFPHCLINSRIFVIRVIEHKMLVLIFSTNLPVPFLIAKRTERGMIMYVY